MSFCYTYGVNTRGPLLAALLGLCLCAPAAALYEGAETASAEPASLASVILDPGHGGQDLGAVAGGRYEKDIALAIARRVKAKLQALGQKSVKLTRDADVYIPLDKRIDESLGEEGLAFVSLHLNETRSKKPHGITVYAFGRQTTRLPTRKRHLKLPQLPPPPKDAARASADLARALVSSLRAQGFRVDPPAKAHFYVLKNPRVPSILIELGYISNPSERARLSSDSYQDKLAEAVAVSLRSYFLQTAAAKPAVTTVASGAR